ncbi:WXG100 family type VII secretion target [Angustibacter aerolatus]
MSTTYQVDTARIATAAADVHRISADVEGQVAALMARLTSLEDAWRGEAATRFQAVAADWRATQLRVRESLDLISRALGSAGEQYAAAEQRNASMFR